MLALVPISMMVVAAIIEVVVLAGDVVVSIEVTLVDVAFLGCAEIVGASIAVASVKPVGALVVVLILAAVVFLVIVVVAVVVFSSAAVLEVVALAKLI